ncbi:DCC1-like thiol-disulfide oxidoreductase family protein [bacterium]|nr:DCC1-like thiol-disulfide oxidoreductase family protein [bacterium]
MKKWLSPWLKIDSRALGIYRILIGGICSLDIIRRWNYIDVFYSNQGIHMASDSKAFNIFYYIGNNSIETHIIFLIGILFSLALMVGYKTKLSHLISAAIIISIHSQATAVGNSGDLFLNSILIWTLFLPLGKSFSLDSIIKSLRDSKELKVEDLNNRTYGINKPIQIYSIAYLAILLQISTIYFLSALNRMDSASWKEGIAFYKMHQLDGFITYFGYYIRESINYPISKFFTYSTLYLEYSIPFLLLFPFYKHILRLIAIISLTTFHLMIRLSIHVGLFSHIMIATFPLLIDEKIINYIKIKILNKYNNRFNLFYDSDCGFCHYSVRIIKRLDIFNRIIFCDGNSKEKKPKEFDAIANQTAILYNPETNITWTRHRAFGKILSIIPFGFLISWIFFIPFLSEFFGMIYDQIAKNRTKISGFFGLPACNIPSNSDENNFQIDVNKKSYIQIHSIKLFKIISPLLIIIMISSSVYSSLIEHKIITGVTWKNIPVLKKINNIPRMIQRWKMFGDVPNSDQIIIVEATLKNNEKINLFTGEKPEFNSTDYTVLMKNKSQLWRKYFEWLYHKHIKGTRNTKLKNKFTNWILNPNNTYFNETLNGRKIKEVEIWKLSENAPRVNNENYKKITIKSKLQNKPSYGKNNSKNLKQKKKIKPIK